ncbi:PREDICTED: uncharacterized protein LOC108617315 isoform X1 [Drosophila arizonae]|uniref:Uncharacterized protein LOC108617315 isoform X1 n=1 Tax=Drosophila arizonae TaxID=7263 RepID=A0ABM1PMW8_DROAR|nr:PREDICTED: uncharacterized protein LOC108617315 isoform X1 [Drosophila arizonae]
MVLLRKFCCFLKLRTGCYLIAVVDLIINLNIIIFSRGKIFTQVERGMAICHCIGCIMLIIGAIVVSLHPVSPFDFYQFVQIAINGTADILSNHMSGQFVHLCHNDHNVIDSFQSPQHNYNCCEHHYNILEHLLLDPCFLILSEDKHDKFRGCVKML